MLFQLVLTKFFKSELFSCLANNKLACKQAPLGALVAGQEKEGELATMSLEFENLHRKS